MFEMMPFRRTLGPARRRDYFDHIFDSFFQDMMPASPEAKVKPFRVDIKESEAAYTIEADLPGFSKEAIEVEYDNNYLTIGARKEESKDEEKENYLRRERSWGEFRRSFYIDNIKKTAIEASFADGVLKVVLPKEQPGEDKKKIDVQ
ncbi:MAG: Hsp20/alpha crystallin family protein [Syntrophomonadaceae bacterium]